MIQQLVSRTAWLLTIPQEMLKNRKDNFPTAGPESVPPFSCPPGPPAYQNATGVTLELCHLQLSQEALSLHQNPLMVDICTSGIQQAKLPIHQTKSSPNTRVSTWKTIFMRRAFKVCLKTQSKFNSRIRCFMFIYMCVCYVCKNTNNNKVKLYVTIMSKASQGQEQNKMHN